MQVIPAIDLLDHKVVRLEQGRKGKAQVYSQSVLDVADRWISQGAGRLHIVDLNGAFEGVPFHHREIGEIAKKFPHVKIQVGGGIRDLATIGRYLACGVSFCILGTVAIQNPDMVTGACTTHPGKIILGVDARNGFVATNGWEKGSDKTALDAVRRFAGCRIESVIYTDIAKDGMLTGMNFEKFADMKQCGFPVIASGGLTSLDDIDRLVTIGSLHGVIAGRAIYEGKFSLMEAIRRALPPAKSC